MKDPRESMDDQPLLWDIPPMDSVAVLSDEQREELRNALMEMLLWSLSIRSAKNSDGGNNGE